jgi:hypothetical protein
VDRDLAKHVVTVGFHSLSLIEGLIPLLKEHRTDAEYNEYLKSIAAVCATMTTEIFNKIFQAYPDLEKEVEQKIQRYGKFI